MTNEELSTFMRAAGFVPLLKYERVHPSFDRAATWHYDAGRKRGAYVEIMACESHIELSRIFVHERDRELGLAGSALTELCYQANRDHITLKLYAANWLGADLFDYIAWYSRFGFVSSLSDKYAMERKPQ